MTATEDGSADQAGASPALMTADEALEIVRIWHDCELPDCCKDSPACALALEVEQLRGLLALHDSEDVTAEAMLEEVQRSRAELEESSRIEREVRELVERHHAAQVSERGADLPWWVGYQVATAELANILEPGSAPMPVPYFGHAAMCGVCLPDGVGVSKWSDR